MIQIYLDKNSVVEQDLIYFERDMFSFSINFEHYINEEDVPEEETMIVEANDQRYTGESYTEIQVQITYTDDE